VRDLDKNRPRKSICDCGNPVVLVREDGFAFDGYDLCYECWKKDVRIK
jgi:hypothetical protein